MIGIMLHHLAELAAFERGEGVCRVCGCTDDDCSQCVEKTGAPCHWVEPDLCSACAGAAPGYPDTRPRDVTGESVEASPATAPLASRGCAMGHPGILPEEE